MSNIVTCTECSTKFNINNYYNCPKCKAKYILPEIVEPKVEEILIGHQNESQTSKSVKKSSKNSDFRNEDELIAAQNRTTHAVRALAITFVAAPILFLVVGGLIVIAASSGNSDLTILALFLGVISFGWILISSLSELAQSKVR